MTLIFLKTLIINHPLNDFLSKLKINTAVLNLITSQYFVFKYVNINDLNMLNNLYK